MGLRPAIAALLLAGLLGTAACGGDRDHGGERSGAKAAGDAGAPAAGAPATSPTASPAAGAPVPATLAFDGRTLDGQAFRGASLAGRPVALWFWAPWCATCAGQAPAVAETAAQFGTRVSVIGVAGLGGVPAMRTFVSDTGVGSVTHLEDAAGVIWRKFQITEQSSYVLIDRDGKVVHRGWLDDADFEAKVKALAG
jgi:thiol-disulfide isomerase/thioredoxin